MGGDDRKKRSRDGCGWQAWLCFGSVVYLLIDCYLVVGGSTNRSSMGFL